VLTAVKKEEAEEEKNHLVEQTCLGLRMPGTPGHIDSRDDSKVAGATERAGHLDLSGAVLSVPIGSSNLPRSLVICTSSRIHHRVSADGRQA